MTGAHLSFLALDGIRLGRLKSLEERTHLAACAACAGYLGAAEQAPALPRPAWLSGVRLPAGPHARQPALRPERRRWSWLLAIAPVVAAALWLLAPAPPGDPTRTAPALSGDGVREKGLPVVRVFVKRGDRVFVWDGKQAVRADDRLRLEVRRGGYRFVSVAALPRPTQPPQVLFEGALDPDRPLLPLSFRVDDRGSEEVLSVILGRVPVPDSLHALAGPPDGEAETWRQILLLEKSDRGGSP